MFIRTCRFPQIAQIPQCLYGGKLANPQYDSYHRLVKPLWDLRVLRTKKKNFKSRNLRKSRMCLLEHADSRNLRKSCNAYMEENLQIPHMIHTIG